MPPALGHPATLRPDVLLDNLEQRDKVDLLGLGEERLEARRACSSCLRARSGSPVWAL
jgi:hypothetical protein